MKCPNCNSEIYSSLVINAKDEKDGELVHNYCLHCNKSYSDREIKDLQDIQMIEEDMQIWRESQKYK